MSEWWTYRLSDLLMFSARSYWRLTESLNRDLWPGQLVAVAAGIVILGCLIRPSGAAQRSAYLMLGAAWAWVGWRYHLQRYADINTGAPYFAGGFALQAVLLWLIAARLRSPVAASAGSRIGLVIAAAGVLMYPVLALAGDHGWRRAEVFGIVPDPTAVTTLGVLLALRAHPIAWLIPASWCAISSATLMELRAAHAWLPAAIAVLAIAAGLLLRRRERLFSSRANSPT
jgi:hypothetical protein